MALLLALAGCGSDDSESGDQGSGGPPGESRGGPPGEARSGGGPPGEARSGGGRPEGATRRGGGPGGGGPPGGWPGAPGGPGGEQGVPVQVAEVARHEVALYFETNGTLEAENEVELVARTAGPVTELLAEEGMRVSAGQLLARIDDRELRAQLEIARVRREETEVTYERVKALAESQLVSQETLDQALASYQSALGDYERTSLQLGYTEITAPFAGLVVERYVKFAEHLASGARLFRISDFDPLLCPIQVPERQLPRLRKGQAAELEVEAFPGRRFRARVLRISPVVEAETGTVRVTLEVDGPGRSSLRPGMFASVYLELESRPDALVIPKAALALDSLGDTVFVADGGVAVRRPIEVGFRNDDLLEVLSGLGLGEPVVVVGQDGLSDGTPIDVQGTLPTVPAAGGEEAAYEPRVASRAPVGDPPPAAERGGPPGFGGPGGGGPDSGRGEFLRNLDWNDAEQVERLKERMRGRGLDEQQIEERLQQMRERRGAGG